MLISLEPIPIPAPAYFFKEDNPWLLSVLPNTWGSSPQRFPPLIVSRIPLRHSSDGLPHLSPGSRQMLGQLILGGNHVSPLVNSIGDVLGYLGEDLRVNGSGSAVLVIENLNLN